MLSKVALQSAYHDDKCCVKSQSNKLNKYLIILTINAEMSPFVFLLEANYTVYSTGQQKNH
jgi:hypothetical protein